MVTLRFRREAVCSHVWSCIQKIGGGLRFETEPSDKIYPYRISVNEQANEAIHAAIEILHVTYHEDVMIIVW